MEEIPKHEVDDAIDRLIKSGNPKFESIGRKLCAMQTLEARHAAVNLIHAIIHKK